MLMPAVASSSLNDAIVLHGGRCWRVVTMCTHFRSYLLGAHFTHTFALVATEVSEQRRHVGSVVHATRLVLGYL